jgi:poly(hydroxyalkanoate) depolymerase family esterase
MSEDFVAAMRRAAAAAQGSDPAGATRIIQEALGIALPELGAALPSAPRLPAALPLPLHAPMPMQMPRGLGDVVQRLREGRQGLPHADFGAPAVEPALPEGARFLRAVFAGPEGSRRYRLYVPAAVAAGAAPAGLVLMLHGCTQTPEDFAVGTGMNAAAETAGLLVAYPAQERGENSLGCWNWFRPGDQGRHRGEAALLAGLVREIVAEHRVPEGRVFAAGLSAGGAMAAVLGESHPEVFAAIGVHSGLPAGAASDVLTAFAAMRGETAGPAPRPRVPTIVFHGTADGTVHPVNAARLAGVADPAATIHGEAGGRSYRRSLAPASDGVPGVECWLIDGAGHAWSGGSAAGSYADPAGPDATAEMLRFFLARQAGSAE